MRPNQKLRELVQKSGLPIYRWAIERGLNVSTFYAIYNGKQPKYRLAKKIVDACEGKLTMADLGLEGW